MARLDLEPLVGHPAPSVCALVPGSWGKAMRGAVKNTQSWKSRRAPTQDPSTNNSAGRTVERLPPELPEVLKDEGLGCYIRGVRD